MLLALLLAVAAPWTEDVPSPRIEAIRREPSALPALWAELRKSGAPLVESADEGHSLVTFVYQSGTAKRVKLFTQLNRARDPNANMLSRLPGTDLWFKTFRLPRGLRLSYGFLADPPDSALSGRMGTHVDPDPLNPKSLPTGYGNQPSALELADAAPQPWLTGKDGKLETHRITSKALNGAERTAYIYTPPGFDRARPEPYPVLLCFDGMMYGARDAIPVPAILDNLIAQKKLPPMLAVLVEQSSQRNAELSNNDAFVSFLADELMPSVRAGWHATADPSLVATCGSSAGGLGAAFAAFRRPDVFGNAISQSGAFWPDKDRGGSEPEWLTRTIAASPRVPVRFLLQVGIVEIVPTPMGGPSILEANRHLRDVLNKKGYVVHYSEVQGGHEPFTWRGGIAPALLALFGKP